MSRGPSTRERVAKLQQLADDLQEAATAHRWIDVASISRDILSIAGRVLNQAQVLLDFAGEGKPDNR